MKTLLSIYLIFVSCFAIFNYNNTNEFTLQSFFNQMGNYTEIPEFPEFITLSDYIDSEEWNSANYYNKLKISFRFLNRNIFNILKMLVYPFKFIVWLIANALRIFYFIFIPGVNS